MKRKIFLLLAFSLVALLGYIYGVRPKVGPFPYSFSPPLAPSPLAQEAQVLIVGDRLGGWFNRHVDSLREKVSEGLAQELKIYNWSARGEGLHRTLEKIRSLEDIPPVVIYHGGSEEFYERRFAPEDVQTVGVNLSRFKERPFSSFPLLAPLFYSSYAKGQVLGSAPIAESLEEMGGVDKFHHMEQTYALFSAEWSLILDTLEAQGSRMIAVTTPINILREYRLPCPVGLTQELEGGLDSIEEDIKGGRTKIALEKLPNLITLLPTYARLHYLLGRAHLIQEQYALARESLDKAAIFDCGLWRGSQVFNSIIRKETLERNHYLIDFHGDIHKFLGRGPLFEDDIYPREEFYRALVEALATLVRSSLNL